MKYKKGLLLLCSLIVLIVWIRIPIMEYFYSLRTNNHLSSLTPDIRAKAELFLLKAAERDIHLAITAGYRSVEDQNKLYAQGRSLPGRIVTYAKGGHSLHNKGTAIDVYPIEFGFVNVLNQDWKEISEIGKSVGFSWGGDWKAFKDRPHFEVK